MSPRLQDIILRDTRANQPLVTDVPIGSIYYVTDEFVTERNNGTNWQDISDVGSSGLQKYTVGITIDGGGSPFATGIKGFRTIPVSGTITSIRLLADQIGDVVIDIWKDIFANFPPTVADTITAAAKPTLTSAQSFQDITLTGWTTTVTAGDVLGFNVDSVATLTRVTLELEISI